MNTFTIWAFLFAFLTWALICFKVPSYLPMITFGIAVIFAIMRLFKKEKPPQMREDHLSHIPKAYRDLIPHKPPLELAKDALEKARKNAQLKRLSALANSLGWCEHFLKKAGKSPEDIGSDKEEFEEFRKILKEKNLYYPLD